MLLSYQFLVVAVGNCVTNIFFYVDKLKVVTYNVNIWIEMFCKRLGGLCMSKDKFLSISILFLAISIIISAKIIANGMKYSGENNFRGLSSIASGINCIATTVENINSSGVVNARNTYDLYSAAAYLGVTEENLKQIVSDRDSGIPYIKVGEDYIFSKGALDKWLENVRVEIK